MTRFALLDSSDLRFGGGYESVLLDLSTAATARGHTVDVITPDPMTTHLMALATNLTLHPRPASASSVTSRLGGGREWRLRPWQLPACVSQADVLYCKNEPQELAFAVLSRPRDVPLVVGMHSHVGATTRLTSKLRTRLYVSKAYGRLLAQADRVHLLQESQREFVCGHHGYPANQTFVVPNGVDLARFTRPRTPPGSRFRLLFVGHLTRQKGLDLLLDALTVLERQGVQDLSLTVAGRGQLQDMIDKFAGGTAIDARGYVMDVGSLMADADLMVLPSRWEASALVPLEAAVAGLAVVVSDIDGFARARELGVPSFQSGDVAALASAIVALRHEWSTQPETWAARVRARAETARERCSTTTTAAALVAELQAAAAQRAVGSA